MIACGLLLAAPVVGQDAGPNRDAPKSLLPPGFDTPAPAPSAAPAPLLPGAAAPPAEAATAEQAPLLTGQPGDVTPPAFVETQTAAALPPGAPIGIIDAAGGAFAADAFIGSNGRFLAGLANRIAGPVASRWVAITLGRALASRVPGPAGIGDGDWVAARAGLLVRMGAVDLARRLIDVLPQERYTPATYRVAGEVSLAAADLAGLCPIAATGRALSDDVMWDLAWGMCAAMDGDDITAAGVIDTVRNRRGALPAFDLRLAQRVVVLAGGAGRADGINWAEEEGLTPYRYGVASAAGVTVPADRLAALGPAHAGWAVRNAALPAATRFALLRQAAEGSAVRVQWTLSKAHLINGGVAYVDDAVSLLRTCGYEVVVRPDALEAGESRDNVCWAMRSCWWSRSQLRGLGMAVRLDTDVAPAGRLSMITVTAGAAPSGGQATAAAAAAPMFELRAEAESWSWCAVL